MKRKAIKPFVSESRRVTRSLTTQAGCISINADKVASSKIRANNKNTLNGNIGKTLGTALKNDVHVIPAYEELKLQEIKIKSFGFNSMLSGNNVELDSPLDSSASPKGLRPVVLRRAVSSLEVDDDSWLSSSLIDLVVSKLSRAYRNTYFMSIDFVVLSLSGTSTTVADLQQATDISGRQLDYASNKPIVFVCNSNNIHWNLIRIVRDPIPQLQVFEPMGKPVNRHGGLSFRDVPRCVVRWLDMCCPLENGVSWLSTGVSAITNQQQFTPFDCGVACLLYAEKCAVGQSSDEINRNTSQGDLTEYRKVLQQFTRRVHDYELKGDVTPILHVRSL